MPRRGARATLVAAMLVASPLPRAHAEEGETTWSFGLAGLAWVTDVADEDLTRQAPLLHVGWRYALTDFWQLGAAARGGVAFGGDPDLEGVAQAFGEARYILDALEWVPFLAAGVGGLLRTSGPDAYAGGDGPALDLSVHAGLGFDYRPSRDWSVGLVGRYFALLTDLDDTTGPFDITLTYSVFSY